MVSGLVSGLVSGWVRELVSGLVSELVSVLVSALVMGGELNGLDSGLWMGGDPMPAIAGMEWIWGCSCVVICSGLNGWLSDGLVIGGRRGRWAVGEVGMLAVPNLCIDGCLEWCGDAIGIAEAAAAAAAEAALATEVEAEAAAAVGVGAVADNDRPIVLAFLP